jgi:tetratricopeptide (TPR) repeat protein
LSPRHHARAIKIFDELLHNGNDDMEIWLGKAYIAQSAENWSEALRNFDRVLQVPNQNEAVALEAREGIAWAQVHGIDIEQGLRTLQSISDQHFESSSRPESIKARLFWKLGQAFLKHS